MNRKIKVFLIFLFMILTLHVYSNSHLKDNEVKFILAQLEGPKESVLKQYAILNGCSEDRATTIVKYLMNPKSEESKKWSQMYLNENWSYDYELIASAYIEGINRNPPVTRIEEILSENNIPYIGQPRGITKFRANLPVYCETTIYPIVSIEPRYSDFTFKGLKCELTEEETKKFRDIIRSDIKNHPEYIQKPFLLYTPIKAYLNQTGDLELISDLWGCEDQEFFCIIIATMAKDPEIVKLILDLIYDLDKRGDQKGEHLRMGVLWLFHEQKDIPEVGARLRQIIKNPGLYYSHIQTLIQILGDPGWPEGQYYNNRTALDTFRRNQDYLSKLIKDTMNMFDLRIKHEK
jgi:hypothetical protein